MRQSIPILLLFYQIVLYRRLSNKCPVKNRPFRKFSEKSGLFFDLCGFCYGWFVRFQYIMLSVMLAQEYAPMYSP